MIYNMCCRVYFIGDVDYKSELTEKCTFKHARLHAHAHTYTLVIQHVALNSYVYIFSFTTGG